LSTNYKTIICCQLNIDLWFNWHLRKNCLIILDETLPECVTERHLLTVMSSRFEPRSSVLIRIPQRNILYIYIYIYVYIYVYIYIYIYIYTYIYIYVYVYIYMWEEIYYKTFAHAITEAGKSYDHKVIQ
jgi:hypothetical protein